VNRIPTVVAGSSAYGLDGPESDHDRRGEFVAPTRPDHIA
jgi:predicted nucleotidyltransferase